MTWHCRLREHTREAQQCCGRCAVAATNTAVIPAILNQFLSSLAEQWIRPFSLVIAIRKRWEIAKCLKCYNQKPIQRKMSKMRHRHVPRRVCAILSVQCQEFGLWHNPATTTSLRQKKNCTQKFFWHSNPIGSHNSAIQFGKDGHYFR